MAEKITFDASADRWLQSKQMDLDAGILGKLFGTSKNAPIYIAGCVVLLLVLAGIAVVVFDTKVQPLEFWKMITPVITLALGFMFGKAGR
jgi:hypothetical protein